jgi:hypothetical protein
MMREIRLDREGGGDMLARRILISFLFLGIFSAFHRTVEGCSFPMFSDNREIYFFFFNPVLAADPRLRPLAFSEWLFAAPVWDSTADAKKDNLAAWQEYVKKDLSLSDLEYVIYQAPLTACQAWAIGGSSSKSAGNRSDAVLKRFAADKDNLTYLLFAKRCEPLVNLPANADFWDADSYRDKPAMETLGQEGRKLLAQAKPGFLRDRYAFQVIRLAHYAGAYEEAIARFDEYFPGRPRKGLIYYWALALKAGALKRLKRFDEASYLFSLVFERCNSRRQEAYYGFHIDSPETLKRCLQRCRDERERSLVHFLKGIDYWNSALTEMADIYRILPDSPHLETLLTREINRLEMALNGSEFNQRLVYSFNSNNGDIDASRENLGRLKTFLEQVVADKKVKRADLWLLALAYARYLGNDLARAGSELQVLRANTATTPAVRQQAETFLWLVSVRSLVAPDRNAEARLFEEYKGLQKNFPRYNSADLNDPNYKLDSTQNPDVEWVDPKIIFLRSVLHYLYQKHNDPPKIFLTDEFSDLYRENKLELADALIQFNERQDKSSFEKYLLHEKFAGLMKIEGASLDWLLREYKGTLLLRRSDWDGAIRMLAPLEKEKKIAAWVPDPFQEYPLNHWGGLDEDSSPEYSKLALAREMAGLKKRIATRPRFIDLQRYANALYNVSYYGPCWELLAYGRKDGWDSDPDSTRALLGLSNKYFVQAEKLAIDREKAARACFRQADIAQKLYCSSDAFQKDLGALVEKRQKEPYISGVEVQFLLLRAFVNPVFKTLKERYADTTYLKQASRECKLFEYYLQRR